MVCMAEVRPSQPEPGGFRQPLLCARCRRPVVIEADRYGVFEQMHYVCFHYEFEHGDADPDEECWAGGCPSAAIRPRPDRRPPTVTHPDPARSENHGVDSPAGEQLSNLLHFAFVEIRACAHEGDNDRAQKLADAFHNAPSAFRTGDFHQATADIASRLQRHGVDLELMPLTTWAT